MVLPELEEFRNFPARGPEGVKSCDINGQAAAIECYLDLNLTGYPPAQVVWSNYKKDIDAAAITELRSSGIRYRAGESYIAWISSHHDTHWDECTSMR